MLSERGLSTIRHCLEWYKLVPRARLSAPAVLYLVLTRTRWIMPKGWGGKGAIVHVDREDYGAY